MRRLDLLLAEDNPVNQKLATRLLEKRGHKVTVVGNGLQALDALGKRSFDLVLMDVQMPEMDGLEATKTLRRLEQKTGLHQAVVAMTALVMKGDYERCLGAGMDGYLSKPIRPEELDEVLDRYVSAAIAAVDAPEPEVADDAAHPAEAAVYMDELMERIEGDREFLGELAEIFRAEYPGQVAKLYQALSAGNGVQVQRAAHSLKGALGNLAARPASRMAAELEAMGRVADLTPAHAKLVELEAEIKRVLMALEPVGAEVRG